MANATIPRTRSPPACARREPPRTQHAGQLSNPGPQAADNATQRCSVFQNADEQAECVRRVNAPVSGSVSAGGVLRESATTTVVPEAVNKTLLALVACVLVVLLYCLPTQRPAEKRFAQFS